MRIPLLPLLFLLLSGAAQAADCPAADGQDPSALLLRKFDTPDFRAELRLGHGWRDSSGFVGEYYSRLELAAFLGDVELVEELAAAPLIPHDILLSAASLSIYEGRKDVLVILFTRAHLSPDARLPNRVPLISLASASGHTDLLHEFIRRHADIYAFDGDALIAAVMNHQQESVKVLLEAGFDQTRSRTTNGLSPIELARGLKDPCIEKLLSVPREGSGTAQQ